jgi:molybdenum storage protein
MKHDNHMKSLFMRESLLDKKVMKIGQDTPTFKLLPDVHIVKIGASSFVDKGRAVTYPIIDELRKILKKERLVISTGGGARSKHLFSVGIDLGMPTGVLAQLAGEDALGNAHILGALLSPEGVIAIPPESIGHLLPLFLKAAPGVVYAGMPPYSLWEHPSEIGNIPSHRTDAGPVILAETFGFKSVTLVKDVDGLFDKDPYQYDDAKWIKKISTTELKKLNLETLPFNRVVIDILDRNRSCNSIQVINGNNPELISAAINGDHVGTIINNEKYE